MEGAVTGPVGNYGSGRVDGGHVHDLLLLMPARHLTTPDPHQYMLYYTPADGKMLVLVLFEKLE